jgi:N-hydroxyarylamine O-acetyltransferase
MSDKQFDQNAWLARIGYSGPVTPTLETLNRLIFAHSHSIAYETLDIMLGHPPTARCGHASAQDDRRQARRILL